MSDAFYEDFHSKEALLQQFMRSRDSAQRQALLNYRRQHLKATLRLLTGAQARKSPNMGVWQAKVKEARQAATILLESYGIKEPAMPDEPVIGDPSGNTTSGNVVKAQQAVADTARFDQIDVGQLRQLLNTLYVINTNGVMTVNRHEVLQLVDRCVVASGPQQEAPLQSIEEESDGPQTPMPVVQCLYCGLPMSECRGH